MSKEILLEGLNEEQLSAVLHGEGPALVVAGPGSGKTTVIVRRLLYLIQEREVPADKILVITFTKEAAVSMQEKYRRETEEIFSSKQLSKGIVHFATFHSYFYQIIRSISKYSEYSLITQREKERIAETILKKENTEEISHFQVKNLLMEISFYKNTGEIKNTEETKVWLGLFENYQKILESHKKMDFDDMLYLCYKELQNNNQLLEYWKKRFSYIMIDEYQDINPIQYQIMKILTHSTSNLLVVGDDDQAIYGFRGSDTESFRKFQSDYYPIHKIFLVKNYRCTEAIINASKRLIERNEEREGKELVSAYKNVYCGKIEAIGCINKEEGMKCIGSKLRILDTDLINQQAILFRTNASLQIFACYLNKNKIPYVIREKGKSIYEHFIACDVLDYFQAAFGNKERSLYLRIFQKIGIGRGGLRKEQVDLEEVKAYYGNEMFYGSETIEKIEALERHLLRLMKMRPGLGLHYIMHGMDYMGYLIRKNNNEWQLPREWQDMLDWLEADAKEYYRFADWMKNIEEFKEKFYDKRPLTSNVQEGIHLMTLHASKGLEFQKVYLWDVNEGNLPQYHKGEEISKERLEEERRLCYVGITRGKEEAELYYTEGGKDSSIQASRFLEEMGLV